MISRQWVSKEEAEKYLPDIKMNRWNYEEFEQKFPHLFTEGTYFECDTGWKDIIWNLCEELEPLCKKIKEELLSNPDHEFFYEGFPHVEQIKEKYGLLRVSMSYDTPEIKELIEDAERLSSITCEVCGCPGKIRKRHWVKTLCETCL
jgi:hypothetical protein